LVVLTCRACASTQGEIVLDLGEMPAADAFPLHEDPGPDPEFPLRMWQCARCGLAQLAEDPTTPDEPRGVEPAALVAQARDAVRRVSGLLRPGMTVAEYGSPHGGSWLPLLTETGLRPVGGRARAQVIVDCFGMMHEPDQAAAVADRAARLTGDGVLLLQYHSLATIVGKGQWNALRHGHFAYYAADPLRAMFARAGLAPRAAWRFDLYGGTVLLAFGAGADNGFTERVAPITTLQRQVDESCAALRDWLIAQRGTRVIGYGAASRAVALLRRAGIDADLLAAVADASPAKQGRRMPGTRIPVISPADLTANPPDALLLFVPDLLTEVRAALPELSGTRWFVAEPTPHEAT
jgi:hypothetical protein